MTIRFPFSALVGQDRLQRALVLAAVNPRIGGVLVRGPRGTGKSTAVRAMADLLPPNEVVADCRYGCAPSPSTPTCRECRARFAREAAVPTEQRAARVVDLPLNASADRVVGSLDLERALAEGEQGFEPGLLADAHRNVLYVDEVNLLDDHLVDLLLDAAAAGENVVEREGLSRRHPAEFVLVGTMNPEEGALRPQLLDRFGIVVDVEGLDSRTDRVTLAERRAAFDADPATFLDAYEDEQRALRERIATARDRLDGVAIDRSLLETVSFEAISGQVDGLRADITVERVARASAALAGVDAVAPSHVREALSLVFPHRVTEAGGTPDGVGIMTDEDGVREQPDTATAGDDEVDASAGVAGRAAGMAIGGDVAAYPVDRTAIRRPRDRVVRDRLGTRAPSRVDARSGRYTAARPAEAVGDVALDATLRAAASKQPARRSDADDEADGRVDIEPADLREKIRDRPASALLVLVIDASGSVMSGRQLLETKRGALSLVEDAYRTRDSVAVVTFRDDNASVAVEPTRDHRRARTAVSNLVVGGHTPLAAGLLTAHDLVTRERRRDETLAPLVVLLSDGQTNVAYRDGGDARRDANDAARQFAADDIPSVFLDTGYKLDPTPDETWAPAKAERIKRRKRENNVAFAAAMDGSYCPLVDLPRHTTLPTATGD